MLNAYFCFDKKIFYRFIAFVTILSDIEKITGPPNFFDMLPVRRLKKVENHWPKLKPAIEKTIVGMTTFIRSVLICNQIRPNMFFN